MPSSQVIVPPEVLAEGFYPAEVESLAGHPVHTFVPVGYEPNYAYPLIVLLHGQGGNERQALKLAPEISRRNYICIALRAPLALDTCDDGEPGYTWGADSPCDEAVEDYVFRAIKQTRRRFHVHSERVFLAGMWEGATLAYRLGVAHPDRFGGIIALNGRFPINDCSLRRRTELGQLRVFMAHGTANVNVPIGMARRDFRLMYAAGLNVQFKTYTSTARLHADMLRDVDCWIQRAIVRETV